MVNKNIVSITRMSI